MTDKEIKHFYWYHHTKHIPIEVKIIKKEKQVITHEEWGQVNTHIYYYFEVVDKCDKHYKFYTDCCRKDCEWVTYDPKTRILEMIHSPYYTYRVVKNYSKLEDKAEKLGLMNDSEKADMIKEILK